MPLIPPFIDELSLSTFGYDLPDDRIARFPLENREASRLLVWRNGQIDEGIYADLPEILPSPCLLVFNNSRVVEARIFFKKKSGGQIEIFCLEPHPSYAGVSEAMAKTGSVLWTCLIGGASKWKRGQLLVNNKGEIRLVARFVIKRQDDFIVEFSWSPDHLSFAEILHEMGSVPLPPYLKRNADASDIERYQTVYAKEAGSVAAPTAGLHFSEHLLKSLAPKNIQALYLTLHVGAGTFMPVKSEKISGHHMHEEYIEVTATAIETLMAKLHEPVIAVGTTSLRTLETLYWLGLKISQDKNISGRDLMIDQWFPYQQHAEITVSESLNHLINWILQQPEKKLITKTQLFIVPGYQFKIVYGLITNFHQPYSTLLLLVAALTGPAWKSAYTFALEHNFRFLSYGDGCLFLP
jgi:S-adenosylmethionine:tRNA ribosyltransferase-isomerase